MHEIARKQPTALSAQEAQRCGIATGSNGIPRNADGTPMMWCEGSNHWGIDWAREIEETRARGDVPYWLGG